MLVCLAFPVCHPDKEGLVGVVLAVVTFSFVSFSYLWRLVGVVPLGIFMVSMVGAFLFEVLGDMDLRGTLALRGLAFVAFALPFTVVVGGLARGRRSLGRTGGAALAVRPSSALRKGFELLGCHSQHLKGAGELVHVRVTLVRCLRGLVVILVVGGHVDLLRPVLVALRLPFATPRATGDGGNRERVRVLQQQRVPDGGVLKGLARADQHHPGLLGGQTRPLEEPVAEGLATVHGCGHQAPSA